MTTQSGTAEHVDVLIIGAGLSGIGAAARLAQEHPQRSYAVLEAREASGGTWDLFRYPGIRSDSDMFTMGYRFRPWRSDQALADGPSILAYVRDTAREHGVDRRGPATSTGSPPPPGTPRPRAGPSPRRPGRPGRAVAPTSSGRAAATTTTTSPTGPSCPASSEFAGTVVHPQHWPEDLDTTGRRVVVIGSGATAMTLVPALADAGAGQVTMLQRSPTYVLSLPGVDPVAQRAAPLAARAAVLLAHPLEEHRRRGRPASSSAGGGRALARSG